MPVTTIYTCDPCWDCVKGRHILCTGIDSCDGKPCCCPVPHDGNRRRPGMGPDGWFDALDDAQEADL